MKTFQQFALEEKKLNEDFFSMISKVKSLLPKIKKKAEMALIASKVEAQETNRMLETFFKQLKNKIATNKSDISEEDVLEAFKQLKDVGKFSVIAPLFLVPGGGTTVTLLYTFAKKYFNINILPDNFGDIFEFVKPYINDNSVEQIELFETKIQEPL